MDFAKGMQYLKICLHFSTIYLSSDKALCIISQRVLFSPLSHILGVLESNFTVSNRSTSPSLSEAFPKELVFM